MNVHFVDEDYDDSAAVKDRNPWWEEMVEHLVEISGVICLV